MTLLVKRGEKPLKEETSKEENPFYKAFLELAEKEKQPKLWKKLGDLYLKKYALAKSDEERVRVRSEFFEQHPEAAVRADWFRKLIRYMPVSAKNNRSAKPDYLKDVIRAIRRRYPDASCEMICEILTENKLPILPKWAAIYGDITWKAAFNHEQLKGAVKTFICRVK